MTQQNLNIPPKISLYFRLNQGSYRKIMLVIFDMWCILHRNIGNFDRHQCTRHGWNKLLKHDFSSPLPPYIQYFFSSSSQGWGGVEFILKRNVIGACYFLSKNSLMLLRDVLVCNYISSVYGWIFFEQSPFDRSGRSFKQR